MRYKLLALFLILVVVISLFPIDTKTVQAKVYKVKDISEDDDSYQIVQDVINQGWMSLTLGKFFPEKNVTRAEFALILTKFNNQLNESVKIKKPSFADVKTKDKYFKYIELQKDMITYYKTKKTKYFKPKEYISREDALVSIVKSLGYDTDEAIVGGADSEVDISEIIEDYNKISPAIENYVNIGVTNELINLIEDGDTYYLYPKKSITRIQLAQLLVNAKDSKDYNKTDSSMEDSNSNDSSIDTENEDSYSESADKTNIKDNSSTNENTKSDSNVQSKNELGYLKITIKGIEYTYKQKSEDSLGGYWYFITDKYSTKNSFVINLPTDIESGDSLTNDSNADGYDSYLTYHMYVTYTNLQGEGYSFGYPYGSGLYDNNPHESSKLTINITENQGKGGYVTGTISGEIVLSDETIYFENGEFKFKLKGSSF